MVGELKTKPTTSTEIEKVFANTESVIGFYEEVIAWLRLPPETTGLKLLTSGFIKKQQIRTNHSCKYEQGVYLF